VCAHEPDHSGGRIAIYWQHHYPKVIGLWIAADDFLSEFKSWFSGTVTIDHVYIRCISVLDFFTTEKRDPQKYLTLSAVICDRKHANGILRPKVDVSLAVQANVKVSAKRLDYYVGITNRKRSFGSNRWARRGQLGSDQNPSWTQLRFLTATACSRFYKNIGHEHANAPTIIDQVINDIKILGAFCGAIYLEYIYLSSLWDFYNPYPL